MDSFFYPLLLGVLVLLPLYTLTWIIQLKTHNAGIVDVLWAFSFPILAMIGFFTNHEHTTSHGLLLAMVVIWGVRLGLYLFFRNVGHPEDVRYTTLRQEWGDRQNVYMLRFYYFQALLAAMLGLPFAIVMTNTSPEISWLEWSGFIIWLVAVGGESLADRQLKRFKEDPSNKGKICEKGLWYYSRHPNYFFEWLVWVAYLVFALGSPWGWLSVICPAAMLFFLLRVTGIPYTETQMIKSRGQAYLAYQKTTSSFIPLPKRHVV